MTIMFICQYCGKECKNSNSLRNHERLCKENPNRQVLKSNFIEYNRKRKSEGIKGENQFTKARRLGIPVPCVSDETKKKLSDSARHRVHSKETKRKISESQIQNMKGLKTNWLNGRKRSYAELYFDKIFVDAEKNYPVGRYRLDYAWTDKKQYIEVDGEQHYTESGLVHDKKRESVLADNGWTCIIRIRWSKYKKMNKEEQRSFIQKILDLIV